MGKKLEGKKLSLTYDDIIETYCDERENFYKDYLDYIAQIENVVLRCWRKKASTALPNALRLTTTAALSTRSSQSASRAAKAFWKSGSSPKPFPKLGNT